MCIIESENCSMCGNHSILINRCIEKMESLGQTPCSAQNQRNFNNDDFVCNFCTIGNLPRKEAVEQLKERYADNCKIRIKALCCTGESAYLLLA